MYANPPSRSQHVLPLLRWLLTHTPSACRSNFTTILPDVNAYWTAYGQISELNVHLNIFERLWAAWYQYMENDTLATGLPRIILPASTSD